MRLKGVRYIQGRNAYRDNDDQKYGIAIHNTSNNASAAAEASYAQRRTDGVSTHLVVDSREVIQSVDTTDRCGHAGSNEGNNHAVAVEIVGTNDKSRRWWLDNVAWDQLGAALAQVVKLYGIQVRRASVTEMKTNPRVRAFYSHDDMRRAWGGTTHDDPGPNFPWDRLFDAVNNALNPKDDNVTQDQFNSLLSNNPDFKQLIWRVEGLINRRADITGGTLAHDENVLEGAVRDIILKLDMIKGLLRPENPGN